MPNTKIKGVILAENNMGDFDKMLTMLTPNVRQNILHSKRSAQTQKCAPSRNPAIQFWRIPNV